MNQAEIKQAIFEEAKEVKRHKPPKGFDITLGDVIAKYNLNEEQIYDLGKRTANRGIANAKMGSWVYYREATIQRLYGEQA